MEQTYIILEGNIPQLQERIDALNKRANKLGVPAVAISVGAVTQREEFQYTNRGWYTADDFARMHESVRERIQPTGRVRRFFPVTIDGEAPHYAGWHLLAVLEPITTESGTTNLIKEVPGQTCPAEYRDQIGFCSHCHKTRRRRETFVVRHEDGRTACVGRQCLKDFLGHADPHQYAQWAEWLFETLRSAEGGDQEEWGEHHADPTYSLLPTLCWTVSVINAEGWRSRTACRDTHDTPTADRVRYLIDGPGRLAPDHEKREWLQDVERMRPTEDHTKTAQAAIAFAKSVEPRDNYLHNIKTLASAEYLQSEHLGLACSIIQAYRKHLGIEAQRKQQAASEWIGAIGKRQEFELTLLDCRGFDGNYGTTYLRRWQDAKGNVAVWWSSTSNGFEVGQTYRVKATVKSHDDYKGSKQTVMSRLAEVSAKQPAIP